MKILHLSDLHYSSNRKNECEFIADKIINHIKEKKLRVDFLFFTGDLVFSGSNPQELDDAYRTFIVPIAKVLNLNKSQIFFTPGNHEVDRRNVSDSIIKNIRSFRNNDEIERFLYSSDFERSLEPTKVYQQFATNFYSKGVNVGSDKVTGLYSAHRRTLNQTDYYGIVSLNSAWTSCNNEDGGKLVFPIEALIEAHNFIKNCHFKIILIHHPLTDFADFNQNDLENFVMSNFNLQFSGHLHKRKDNVMLTLSEGIYCSHSFASLVKKGGGKMGYSLFHLDPDNYSIKLEKFLYEADENIFISLPNVSTILPHNNEKQQQIKLLETIRRRFNEAQQKANSLFVSHTYSDDSDFNSLFSEVPLYTKANIGVQQTKVSHDSIISIDRLVDSAKNYIIYGKDKSGKTSLLYKINLELLKSFRQYGVFPCYIDCTAYSNPNSFNFHKEVSRFLELNNKNTAQFVESHELKILIDNYSPDKEFVLKSIESSLLNHERFSIIMVAQQTVLRSFKENTLGLVNTEALYIHDLKRSEVRQITNKWSRITEDDREVIINKIHTVFKQYQIPFNYWTVSIFLWIFSVNRNLNYHNNSELIEVYIDNLLDKQSLALSTKKTFSFLNYKEYLSHLAFQFLHKRDKIHSMSYAELVNETENFLQTNIRLVGKSDEIITYLLEKGVLCKNEFGNFTFRLNGVFEYFLAYYLKDNPKKIDEILADDTYYLSFKNEFDLYSGFDLNTDVSNDFLTKIYSKTKLKFEALIKNYDQDSLDVILDRITIDATNILDSLSTNKEINEFEPLSQADKDKYWEKANPIVTTHGDVRKKELFDSTAEDYTTFENHLFILARVYRNSYKISEKGLNEEMLEFIIKSSSFLLFEFIEDIKRKKEAKEPGKDYMEELIIAIFDALRSLIPAVIQAFLNDALAHVNLLNTIDLRIERLSKNPSNNQLELFILYFLKIDLDPKKNFHLIDEVLSSTKKKSILNSLLLKLLYYHFFINDGAGEFNQFLKSRIQSTQLKINPEIDKSKFDSRIEEQKKQFDNLKKLRR